MPDKKYTNAHDETAQANETRLVWRIRGQRLCMIDNTVFYV